MMKLKNSQVVLISMLCLSLAMASLLIIAPAISTVTITPNVKTDACSTGFTRIQPNFCITTAAGPFFSTFTLDGVCRTLTVTGIPSTTSLIYARLDSTLTSQNAVGLKNLIVTFFRTAGCTNSFTGMNPQAREEVAVVAGTSILSATHTSLIFISSGTVIYQGSITGGAGTGASLSLVGYYD